MFELRNISQSYADIKILDNINFNLKSKQKVAIIGSSGSGKTTFLHIAALLKSPDSGSVLYFNNEIHEDSALKIRRNHIGFVYQQHNLMGEFSILENVIIAYEIKKDNNSQFTSKEINQKAIDLFINVGLGDKIHKKPAELSGGECQRASIVRAVFSDNKKERIIFADEPTGNLDPQNAEQTISVMLDVIEKSSASLVMVTHNIEIAKKMDIIYEIRDRKLSLLQV